MPCDREELLNRFLDGDLSPKEAADFRQHLSGCPSCRMAQHEIHESEKQVREVFQATVGGIRLGEKVLRRIQLENLKPFPADQPPKSGTRMAWKLALGFGLALVAVVCLSLLSPGRPTPPAPHHGELVSISSLGSGAELGGVPFLDGKNREILAGVIAQFQGPIGFSDSPGDVRFAEWQGKGLFSISPTILNWESGDGEIALPPGGNLEIRSGTDKILLEGACARISGSRFSGICVTLIKGKATIKGKEISQPMHSGMTVKLLSGRVTIPSETVASSPVLPVEAVSVASESIAPVQASEAGSITQPASPAQAITIASEPEVEPAVSTNPPNPFSEDPISIPPEGGK